MFITFYVSCQPMICYGKRQSAVQIQSYLLCKGRDIANLGEHGTRWLGIETDCPIWAEGDEERQAEPSQLGPLCG
jgi:hypothetical protein